MGDKSENKVWTGRDGILYVKVIKTSVEEDVFEILGKIEEALKKSPPKTKILVSMLSSSIIKSSKFRNKCGEKIKKLYKNIGFGKAAIFGLNVTLRTIAKFIIVASGIKNIKVFSSEKEALKWLKVS
jgi:hypothetical protein